MEKQKEIKKLPKYKRECKYFNVNFSVSCRQEVIDNILKLLNEMPENYNCFSIGVWGLCKSPQYLDDSVQELHFREEQ